MALLYPERTQETTTSTGTGDLALQGAPDTSYHAIGDRLVNSDQTDVAIFGAAAFETCRITYNAGANTITRGEIYDSSSGGDRVDFGPGPKTIIVGLPGKLWGLIYQQVIDLAPTQDYGLVTGAVTNTDDYGSVA